MCGSGGRCRDRACGSSSALPPLGADLSHPPEIPRTLVVTGHFPPQPGGVQTFTYELLARLPAERLVVVAPAAPGAEASTPGSPTR